MATLILLNKTELPKGTPSEALVAVWDKGSVPDGQISIPVELNERLLPIRDDLAAWTYETGCARINGKLLEEHLRADDNLSMWWCSTLVEKHPKVTHNLFPALKLRALELLLDEKGVTRLELCAAAGADRGWKTFWGVSARLPGASSPCAVSAARKRRSRKA